MAGKGALLLDLDGTVWDSRPWFAQILHAAGGELPAHLELLSEGASAATLMRDAGIGEAALRKAALDAPPPLYGGIGEALSELAEQGTPLGAVTNLPAWICNPLIQAHGAALPLEVCVTWGDTRRRKPRADPILCALERLELEPGPSHWYLGDSASDCAAAKAAGISFAWASWGYGAEAPEGSDCGIPAPGAIVGLR